MENAVVLREGKLEGGGRMDLMESRPLQLYLRHGSARDEQTFT